MSHVLRQTLDHIAAQMGPDSCRFYDDHTADTSHHYRLHLVHARMFSERANRNPDEGLNILLIGDV